MGREIAVADEDGYSFNTQNRTISTLKNTWNNKVCITCFTLADEHEHLAF